MTEREVLSNIDTTRFYPNRLSFSEHSPAVVRWHDVAQQLLDKCMRVDQSLGTMYNGRLGILYLQWKWARLSGNQQGIQSLCSELERRVLDFENNPPRTKRVTLLESPYVGCKALYAAVLYDLQRPSQQADQLVEWIRTQEKSLPMNECDVLYGRAGMIHAILFLRQALQQPKLGSDTVLSLAESIVKSGKQTKPSYVQLDLAWTWHDTFYLGAAHGVVGILQTLLSLHPDELVHLPMDSIRRTIDQLPRYTHESGNLDSSIDSRRDRLVHWCHGAPGHVLLLAKAARVFQQEAYLRDAEQIALNVIWPRGLLYKGVGLCHGISGNAYALLALERFKCAAEVFAEFAFQALPELEDVPDRPYSLFGGLGGLCALAMDLSVDLPACFPLYAF